MTPGAIVPSPRHGLPAVRRVSRMASASAFAVVLATTVACGPGVTTDRSGAPTPRGRPPAGGSGIRGIVEAGPQCPVEHEGTRCPPAPIETTVVVRSSIGSPDPKRPASGQGQEVARIRTGADGRFQVEVGPGEYVVETAPDGPMICQPSPARVASGSYVDVVVRCDSGIR